MALSEEEAAKLQEEKANLEKALQDEKDRRLTEQNKIKERTRETFQKMKDECNNKVQELNQQLQEEKRKCEALKSHEDKQLKEIEDKAAKIKALEQGLEEAKRLPSSSESAPEDKEATKAHLEKIADLEAKLAAADEQAKAKLQEVVEKAKGKVAELMASNQELQEGRKSLEAKLEAMWLTKRGRQKKAFLSEQNWRRPSPTPKT